MGQKSQSFPCLVILEACRKLHLSREMTKTGRTEITTTMSQKKEILLSTGMSLFYQY